MFLTPTGGPLLRPSNCNLDEFIADGLQRRKRPREKLCTGLYSNLHQRYRICTKYTVKEWPDPEVYEIRNLLWARVMRLAGARGVSRPRQDVEAAQHPTKPVSATGLVDHIVLESLADTKDSKMSSHILSVHGDVGELRARILVGLQVSSWRPSSALWWLQASKLHMPFFASYPYCSRSWPLSYIYAANRSRGYSRQKSTVVKATSHPSMGECLSLTGC